MFQTMKKKQEIGQLVLEEFEFPNDVVERMLFYLYMGVVPDVEILGWRTSSACMDHNLNTNRPQHSGLRFAKQNTIALFQSLQ